MNRERILVIDDEESIRFVISTFLAEEGFDVVVASSAEQGLEKLDEGPFAVVFLDIILPGRPGLDLLDPIRQENPHTQVVVMTSHASTRTAVEALRKGAYDYIHKPFELDDILAVTRRAIDRASLQRSNQELLAEQARQNAELRGLIQRLASLNAAGMAMSGIAELPKLLDYFVGLVEQELKAERVSLMLMGVTSSDLEIVASRGLSESIVRDTRVPLGVGVAGRVAKEGRMIYSEAAPEQVIAGDHPGAKGPFMAVPVAVSVPIRTALDVLGVLNVTNRAEGRPFSDDDASYLMALAGQAAVAIERARQSDRLRAAFEELKDTQQQLVAAGRLKALGEMAAGVAHDFNNVLHGILTRGQLIRRQLALEPTPIARIDEYAAAIDTLARQGAASVQRIQEFSRIRKDVPKDVARLDEVARNAVSLTETKWNRELHAQGIDIRVDCQLEEVPVILGHAPDLTQAVCSVIFNAVEAMPDGGQLTLRTWCQGNEACLEVGDTGHGITEEDREKIFEPFFSTKPGGQGLGLSVVYGIVSRLNGRVEAESGSGEGTRFRLTFPIPDATLVAQETVTAPGGSAPMPASRKVRVLVVDDEEMNRESCRDCLEFEGHEVRTVASGPEAIEALEQEAFDLVITDLSMPGLSGWDVARAVKQHSPNTPVMLLSGWSVQQAEADAHAAGVDLIMSKPIGMDALLNSVNQLLAA